MTITDQQVRSEFIFLTIQKALDFLKTGPTRAEVEERSAIMKAEIIAGGRKHYLGDTELFRRPGSVFGRCTSTIHTIIHNITLGDYVERNNRAGKGTPEQRGSDGSAARHDSLSVTADAG